MHSDELHKASKKADNIIRQIGYVLIKVRTENGFTREYMSDLIGVNELTIRRAEITKCPINLDKMAEPRLSTLLKLCTAYKIDLSELIQRAEILTKSEEENGI